jgi:putative glutamine amidotransferase
MIDELRRRGRRATAALADAGDIAADETPEPDAARAALSGLSPHDRLLILLRFDAGLQHAEVAQLLAISEEAARKRVARARMAFVRAYRRAHSDGPPLILVGSHDRFREPYVRWLERAGARVRLVGEAPTERTIALSDGFVCAGAYDDIHSGLYGETPRSLRGEVDLARDRADLAVVAAVLALDIPYVGVCRGHQLLNIACGGTLYQDVVLDGAAAASHDTGLHPVETRRESASRSIYGRSVDVMSEHHQAVRRIGRNLRVAAVSGDGVVESIEHDGQRFAIGVQWHPEAAVNGEGERLAEALVQAAAEREVA